MEIPITLCAYAQERHRDIARWRHLWNVLVFAFGTAVVLFLIVAVLLLIRTSWITGAVSTVGTIASGMAMKWVTDRRKEAVEEEQNAYDEVVKQCGEDSEAAKGARTLADSYNLF